MNVDEAKDAAKSGTRLLLVVVVIAVMMSIYILTSTTFSKWYQKQQNAQTTARMTALTDFTMRTRIPVQSVRNTLAQFEDGELYYILIYYRDDSTVKGNAYTYDKEGVTQLMNNMTSSVPNQITTIGSVDSYVEQACSFLQQYSDYYCKVAYSGSDTEAPHVRIIITTDKVGDGLDE